MKFSLFFFLGNLFLSGCHSSTQKASICSKPGRLDAKNAIALPYVVQFEDAGHNAYVGYHPTLSSCTIAINIFNRIQNSKATCLSVRDLNKRFKFQHFFECDQVETEFEL